MSENYLERNGGWLIPFFVGLIVVLATIMLEMIEITSPLPSWVSSGIASLGFVISGINAIFTDTFSAKIIRFLAGGFAISMEYSDDIQNIPLIRTACDPCRRG